MTIELFKHLLSKSYPTEQEKIEILQKCQEEAETLLNYNLQRPKDQTCFECGYRAISRELDELMEEFYPFDTKKKFDIEIVGNEVRIFMRGF